jgi:hypothetical protein
MKRFLSAGACACRLSICYGRKRIRQEGEEGGKWKKDAVSYARTESPLSNRLSEGVSEADEEAGGPIPKSSQTQPK